MQDSSCQHAPSRVQLWTLCFSPNSRARRVRVCAAGDGDGSPSPSPTASTTDRWPTRCPAGPQEWFPECMWRPHGWRVDKRMLLGRAGGIPLGDCQVPSRAWPFFRFGGSTACGGLLLCSQEAGAPSQLTRVHDGSLNVSSRFVDSAAQGELRATSGAGGPRQERQVAVGRDAHTQRCPLPAPPVLPAFTIFDSLIRVTHCVCACLSLCSHTDLAQ